MPTFESVLAEEPACVAPQFGNEGKLLSISPNEEDHKALRGMVDSLHWQVWSVPKCWDALGRLSSERIAVVFCDAILEDGTWKDILNQVGTGSGAPPLIVTSRLADASLWSEVLNLGGYDVLIKPFNAREVGHVLRNVSLRMTAKYRRTRVAGAV